MDRFESIKNDLVRQEQELRESLEASQKTTKDLADTLSQVQAALKALNGGKRSIRSKAVTNKQVRNWIHQLLKQHGAQTQEALLAAIEKEIEREGLSRSGLSLRMEQSLNTAAFCQVGDRWQLQSTTNSQSS